MATNVIIIRNNRPDNSRSLIEFYIYRVLCVRFTFSRTSSHSSETGVKDKCTRSHGGRKFVAAVKKRTDNLSPCIRSNGRTRIRNEYTEETPFSRLLRASAWHLISRESYWHFDRRAARYLVFAFPALILLESTEWSRQPGRVPWIEQYVASEYLITGLAVSREHPVLCATCKDTGRRYANRATILYVRAYVARRNVTILPVREAYFLTIRRTRND